MILDQIDSYLNLSTTGWVSGTAICNNFMGEFTSQGNTISFWKLGLTRKMCAWEDANAYEQAIMKTLENVTIVELSRTNLTLKSADGEYIINYSVK